MNNFMQRTLTGIVFAGLVILFTWLGTGTFLTLLLIICAGCMHEFIRIVTRRPPGFPGWIIILTGLGMILTRRGAYDINPLFYPALAFSMICIAVLFSGKRSWERIGWYMTALIYVSLPLALFYQTVAGEDVVYEPGKALNLIVMIWSSDTFAYLTGRAFGKTRLFPQVSPGKTVEGFIGGAVLTAAFSLLLARIWDIPLAVNLGIALVTVVFGTLGDLVESMLKREFGVKDSGNILPGHGGMLDRFDALLISLPFTCFLYMLML